MIFVRTVLGWGILHGEVGFAEKIYCCITLITNSYAPGLEIFAYPKDLIYEYEEVKERD